MNNVVEQALAHSSLCSDDTPTELTHISNINRSFYLPQFLLVLLGIALDFDVARHRLDAVLQELLVPLKLVEYHSPPT